MNDFKAYGDATIPCAGMIGLTQISGQVGAGIRLGQFLNGEGFGIWEHAFVLLPGDQILEAEPGGAVIRPLHYDNVYWCAGIFELLSQRLHSVDLMSTAESLRGVPYSFLDYAALSARRLHIPAPHLRSYISSTGHMICSQMADEFYARLGAHIFTDDRWNGDVTPASLYKRDFLLR